MDGTITKALASDREALAAFAAALQGRPESYVCYAGSDAATIAKELADMAGWWHVSAVARRDRDLLGFWIGDTDPDMGRVWWWGPFLRSDAWEAVADALYDSVCAHLPGGITEEEIAVDRRFTRAVAWAMSRGFREDPASAVLSLAPGCAPREVGASVLVRDLRDSDTTVAALHDSLFPGTHATGSHLLRVRPEREIRLVAEEAGRVAGYVAAEVQPDGEGYLDFLGVAPDRRGRGIGRILIARAVERLRERGSGRIHLTVREANAPARALYAAVGFEEERVVVPLRKGFTIPDAY